MLCTSPTVPVSVAGGIHHAPVQALLGGRLVRQFLTMLDAGGNTIEILIHGVFLFCFEMSPS